MSDSDDMVDIDSFDSRYSGKDTHATNPFFVGNEDKLIILRCPNDGLRDLGLRKILKAQLASGGEAEVCDILKSKLHKSLGRFR